MLIARTFAATPTVSRKDLLGIVLADVSWDDELVLVRPLRIWVDRILSLLCDGKYLRRLHSDVGMSYEITDTWSRAHLVLEKFQHPLPSKRSLPAPKPRRSRLGSSPADVVVGMKEWAELREQQAQKPRRRRSTVMQAASKVV